MTVNYKFRKGDSVKVCSNISPMDGRFGIIGTVDLSGTSVPYLVLFASDSEDNIRCEWCCEFELKPVRKAS